LSEVPSLRLLLLLLLLLPLLFLRASLATL
jgi:hypothetical protein